VRVPQPLPKKTTEKADMGIPCRDFGVHRGIIWTMYVSQGPPLHPDKNVMTLTGTQTPSIWLSNDNKTDTNTDTMSIVVPKFTYDAIIRAQERARRRFAGAYEPYDDDDMVLTNISQDVDAPFVVAIRNNSVYEWDEEAECVGEFLGFLAAAEEEEAEDDEEEDDEEDAEVHEMRQHPSSSGAEAQPDAEEMTVMPAKGDDGWDEWDVAKVD
jgi:hypothetical protein